jgi:hypothetical protein
MFGGGGGGYSLLLLKTLTYINGTEMPKKKFILLSFKEIHINCNIQ